MQKIKSACSFRTANIRYNNRAFPIEYSIADRNLYPHVGFRCNTADVYSRAGNRPGRDDKIR
ncbi:hypothetical protein SDC9_151589 [bioreactor metagenome]|uniref:Uncharacterized protein n=1 Tax=bioreactor metagenome TaxID=1076179 RepID=A0A645EST9_9ZZZZ